MRRSLAIVLCTAFSGLLLARGAFADPPAPMPDAAAAANKRAQDAADRSAERKDAREDKAAQARTGNSANVNGNSATTETRRSGPAERFGRMHQLVFSSDEALTISSTTISGVSGSTTTLELQPGFDWFVIDNLSIGGFVEFNYTSDSDGHASTFGIGPRVGYNFSISDLLSVWPTAGFSIDSTHTTVNGVTGTSGTGVTDTNLALNLFVPLMFHPAAHFFAGFGPFLDTDLSGDAKATTWGGKLTLGGWVGL